MALNRCRVCIDCVSLLISHNSLTHIHRHILLKCKQLSCAVCYRAYKRITSARSEKKRAHSHKKRSRRRKQNLESLHNDCALSAVFSKRTHTFCSSCEFRSLELNPIRDPFRPKHTHIHDKNLFIFIANARQLRTPNTIHFHPWDVSPVISDSISTHCMLLCFTSTESRQ